MFLRAFILYGLCGSFVIGFSGGFSLGQPIAIPQPEEILKTLHPEHPRLIVGKDDFQRMVRLAAEEELAGKWLGQIRSRGEELLQAPVSVYEIPDGLRLLSTSRRVLDRVYTLALLARADNDPKWHRRAWAELEAASRFPDWNPRHFLDTAEMSHAFAIALDWLYDAWSAEERQVLVDSIVKFGLKPGMEAYEGKSSTGWWAESDHNWNQVCNGGLAIAALAVAEVEPELSAKILHEALRRLPKAMVHYGPDGAWNEGPGYWHYATRYNVYALAALETALGTDFGLSGIDGFSEAGTFPIYMTGPTGKTFNFGDGGDGAIRAEEMFWLARRFDRSEYAAYERSKARPTVLDLVWYDPADKGKPLPKLPLDRYFRSLEGAALRSSWEDPNALFVGFKAGDNKANHSNLDIGGFVFEALGERWVIDLGRDDYNLPGYFSSAADGKRWQYYRMRAEGHNTLLLGPGAPPDQSPLAAARITRFEAGEGKASLSADLTPAYPGKAARVTRTLSLGRNGPPADARLDVTDEIETVEPMPVWWFAHTMAEVELQDQGRKAVLRLNGKEIEVRLNVPENARFEVMDARPLGSSPDPEGQDPNEGIRKLAINLEGVRETTISVSFSPRSSPAQ